MTDDWGFPRVFSLTATAPVVVGAFFPWVELSFRDTSLTTTGIEADGLITLSIAVLLAAAVVWQWTTRTQLVVLVGGAVVAAVGAYYVFEPTAGVELGRYSQQQTRAIRASVAPGIGLFLTAFGGVGVALSGVAGLLTD